jgi:hypothetical protein
MPMVAAMDGIPNMCPVIGIHDSQQLTKPVSKAKTSHADI